MHKLLPKGDHVVNRDRQDPSAVLALTNKSLTEYLSSLGHVSTTIIPEMSKFTEDNKIGLYPRPIDVCVGTFGTILALYDYNDQDGTSNLLSARLRCPVDQIKILRKGIPASEIHYEDGVAYLCGRSTEINIVEIIQERIHVNSKKRRTKAGYVDILKRLGLETTGTATVLKNRLENHIGPLEKQYESAKTDKTIMQVDQVYSFESITPIRAQSSLIAASSSHHCILKLVLKFDGVGIKASAMRCFDYHQGWDNVRSLCNTPSSIFLSHSAGISQATIEDDATYNVKLGIKNDSNFDGYKLAPFKEGILITDIVNRKIWFYCPNDEIPLKLFAGSGESVHREGPALQASFCKPSGLSVEFDNVVLVSDVDANRINVVTNMKETSQFLDNVGKLYQTFSIHVRGKKR